MSKRKGVTADEKRARVLQIFHETTDFYQLKEIEKIASKNKGINAQYVKDIVQNLVDDGLVDSEKIGISTFFWSHPCKKLNNRKKTLEDLMRKIEETSGRLNVTTNALAATKVSNEDSEEKKAILREIESMLQTEKNLTAELEDYKDNDPEKFQKMQDDAKAFNEAANRWTDNIFTIKSWSKRKFMIEDSILDKHFNIPADLDYL